MVSGLAPGSGEHANPRSIRADVAAVNLDGYGTLQHRDRYNQAPFGSLLDKNALEILERAMAYPDALSYPKEWMRFGREAGLQDSIDSSYLTVRNGRRVVAATDNRYHAQSAYDWQALVMIESAEDIPWKQRYLSGNDAIGPSSAAAIDGQVMLIPLTFKDRCDKFFLIGSRAHTVPWKPRLGGNLPTEIARAAEDM